METRIFHCCRQSHHHPASQVIGVYLLVPTGRRRFFACAISTLQRAPSHPHSLLTISFPPNIDVNLRRKGNMIRLKQFAKFYQLFGQGEIFKRLTLIIHTSTAKATISCLLPQLDLLPIQLCMGEYFCKQLQLKYFM